MKLQPAVVRPMHASARRTSTADSLPTHPRIPEATEVSFDHPILVTLHVEASWSKEGVRLCTRTHSVAGDVPLARQPRKPAVRPPHGAVAAAAAHTAPGTLGPGSHTGRGRGSRLVTPSSGCDRNTFVSKRKASSTYKNRYLEDHNFGNVANGRDFQKAVALSRGGQRGWVGGVYLFVLLGRCVIPRHNHGTSVIVGGGVPTTVILQPGRSPCASRPCASSSACTAVQLLSSTSIAPATPPPAPAPPAAGNSLGAGHGAEGRPGVKSIGYCSGDPGEGRLQL